MTAENRKSYMVRMGELVSVNLSLHTDVPTSLEKLKLDGGRQHLPVEITGTDFFNYDHAHLTNTMEGIGRTVQIQPLEIENPRINIITGGMSPMTLDKSAGTGEPFYSVEDVLADMVLERSGFGVQNDILLSLREFLAYAEGFTDRNGIIAAKVTTIESSVSTLTVALYVADHKKRLYVLPAGSKFRKVLGANQVLVRRRG